MIVIAGGILLAILVIVFLPYILFAGSAVITIGFVVVGLIVVVAMWQMGTSTDHIAVLVFSAVFVLWVYLEFKRRERLEK